jgi:G3E family GTPase
MDVQRIPILILTGFLGSGKTSLLNAMLKNMAFQNTAFIVNEFGEIGLDHLLIESAKENTILLDAGCLCCTVIDSLKETLRDLYHRRVRGQVPEFQRLVIETTGLADPGPILQQITRDPIASHFYRLRGLICTVDALFGLDQLADHPEAAAQVAFADRLIVTKTDLTGNICPPALEAKLRALNPTAEIDLSRDAAAFFIQGERAESPPWLNDIGHGHDHAHHNHAISSESFWLDRPVSWAGLAAWTEWMRQRFGPGLLRCKALLNIDGSAGPVVLHGVRDRFDTQRLSKWPDAERRSRLVIIGRDLDRAGLAAGLGWFYVDAGTQPPATGDAIPGGYVRAVR